MAESKAPQYSKTQPEVPNYTPFTPTPAAMTAQDYINMANGIMQAQIAMAPQLIGIQNQAINTLYPTIAKNIYQADNMYAGAYSDQLQATSAEANPQFLPLYNQLGQSLSQELANGYKLGDPLTQEITQSIRAGQIARGNWMGNAPLAQEAFGVGQAALQLYNNRVTNAQNFLNSKQPTDLWGTIASTTRISPTMVQAQIPSTANYVNLTAPQSVFSTVQSAKTADQQIALQANDQNNNWMYQQYDRTADAWMYNEAVRRGLYSTPSVGGGAMGGMGSILGPAIGAAGSIGGALIGGGGVAAAAGGVGAAASAAAAALCWVAQAVIPHRWKEFRRWLCTKASPEFRKAYIFNGRRIASSLTDERKSELARLMDAVLENAEMEEYFA